MDKKGSHELFGPVNKLYCTAYDRAMVLYLACLKVNLLVLLNFLVSTGSTALPTIMPRSCAPPASSRYLRTLGLHRSPAGNMCAVAGEAHLSLGSGVMGVGDWRRSLQSLRMAGMCLSGCPDGRLSSCPMQ